MKRLVAGALAVGLGVGALLGGAAIAQTGKSSADTFYACAKGSKVIPGTLSIAPRPCKGGATLVTWNAQGPAGPGTKTIAGLVNIDGTVGLGSGFTASKVATGEYELNFPAGTWSTFPVIVVTPFGLPGVFPIAEVGSIVGSGGAATARILTSSTAGAYTRHDVAFWFIAVAS